MSKCQHQHHQHHHHHHHQWPSETVVEIWPTAKSKKNNLLLNLVSKIFNKKSLFNFKNYFDREHFQGNVEALHQSILWISVLYTLSEINGKATVLAQNVMRKVCVEEMQRMYTCGHFFMDKKTGWLINWELKKSSSLIGHLTTVGICDWLKQVKRIYDPSFLLVHG